MSPTPTPDELLQDPCTPYWAQELIRILMNLDPVDVANVLDVLAQSFRARLKGMQ